MANILRVKYKWTGFSGAPGYTVLHFRTFDGPDGGSSELDGAAAARAVQQTWSFFDSIKSLLPSTVRLNVEPDVDRLEDSTGELNDSFGVGIAEIAGTAAAGGYSAASGAVVNWRTNGIRNGRKIRGRSFLVPLAGIAQDTDGDLKSTARATLQTASDLLAFNANSPDLGVYARPTAKGASDGAWYRITGNSVPPMLAVLRSRRD